jgi:flagellar basal body-associated protein FliL
MRKRIKKRTTKKWIWILLLIPVAWLIGSIGLSLVWPGVAKEHHRHMRMGGDHARHNQHASCVDDLTI